MDSRILNIQLALFFETPISRPDELISPLDKKLNKLFDGIPTIMPMPDFDKIKVDLPVVQLTSKTSGYRCNISKTRIDFFYRPKKIVKDFKNIKNDFNGKAIKFIEAVIDSNFSQINRIGFVADYFIEHSNPSSRLQKKYISLQLGDLRDIAIRFNKENKIENLSINDITNIQTGFLIIDKKQKKGFLIQRDINNIVEKDLKFNLISLKNFLNYCYNFVLKNEIARLV